MALTGIAIAGALVVAWFLAWELATARLERGSNAGGWLRAPARIYVAEGVIITLFGALWFGSLGTGGWPLMFGLLGLMTEWPGPLRAGQRLPGTSGQRARAVGAGIARALGAGAIMWWRLR